VQIDLFIGQHTYRIVTFFVYGVFYYMTTFRLFCISLLCLLCFVPASAQMVLSSGNTTLLRPVLSGAVMVQEPVKIKNYFEFIDKIVAENDTSAAFTLDEYLLVRSNPWLIDRLADTDYYRQAAKGKFVADQRELTVLQRGDTLHIPTADEALALLEMMENTYIDVNIPEYRLRIAVQRDTLFSFPIRVGQRKEKFLETSGRETDLRTQIGTGEIAYIERDAAWVNPVDGHQYKVTRRDDGRVTKCPRVPWLEPSINGERIGQWIHPTTNPASLGKTYSNGCIGMAEWSAWYTYYYAPLGTKIRVRYDLEKIDFDGTITTFPDVYGKNEGRIGAFKVLKNSQSQKEK
jgi:L,D-transpeptidase ErfK/SrfK